MPQLGSSIDQKVCCARTFAPSRKAVHSKLARRRQRTLRGRLHPAWAAALQECFQEPGSLPKKSLAPTAPHTNFPSAPNAPWKARSLWGKGLASESIQCVETMAVMSHSLEQSCPLQMAYLGLLQLCKSQTATQLMYVLLQT